MTTLSGRDGGAYAPTFPESRTVPTLTVHSNMN